MAKFTTRRLAAAAQALRIKHTAGRLGKHCSAQLCLYLLVMTGASTHTTGSVAQPAPVMKVSRHSAERPTALPEDRALAAQLAHAAAGYAIQVKFLSSNGQNTDKLLPLANWLYFNAIDLSDEAYAKKATISGTSESCPLRTMKSTGPWRLATTTRYAPQPTP